jgi:uncharacterized protein YllA (UPF0747 family)
MLTAMGAAKLIQLQHPGSRVVVRDLQTGLLTELPTTIATVIEFPRR